MSTAILFLLLLLEAHSFVFNAIYFYRNLTLPGQSGIFIMWQNFYLRILLLCKSCEIKASDIFLSPKCSGHAYFGFSHQDWILSF